ncbi:SDR family oxidoreductase [Plantibacter sp. VKM Ac-2880]|uniref:SDR family oxidoreductase n=1 Tax=Plantibacter sp. VKM Ac-2880 TaxID=2783827 RepID=UPI00188FEAD9|nr:SDR family oxidoreductase [Plantibacter sp. VKM Ac-2880]MBF4570183.1 SDR family oxidoreductase [Plantibacter sp. VKM Ac-2880]
MTDVVIAGGHGQIALHLQRLLAEAGHTPAGIIRNPEQVGELQGIGSRAIVLDLEHSSSAELADELAGTDVVVFAAGAGPNSGADRKLSLDRDGAVLLAEAAELAKVPRYIMVSAMGTDDFDPESDDVFQVYLRAKSEADADLRGRDLDWTIVRPGGLTDDAPAGTITAATTTDRGSIPRADVAAVLFALIESGAASRTQFEVIGGETPIREALSAL